ncbi:MAG: putative nucleotidyltransferase [Symbiobacteriaceae bacterium]|jgi:putative nucleotidyltransferase with HDIG domain|nr:putative nucleotidyltransferase [Symbiobacteriaceae bacterium]
MSLSRRLRLLAGRLALPRRLERALPRAALEIMAALADRGHEVGLVGGAVRDLLLGLAPKDWDMVTSATPAEIMALFPSGRVMGASRGGTTVLIPREGEPFEVTPYRGANLGDDLAHRDFTMNAMALGLDGTLHDPLGGQHDLVAGVVRACLDPVARLDEDPLRALRAIRLAAQFEFDLDPALATAVPTAAPRLQAIAPERIGAEFARILATRRPVWAMERLQETGLLAAFAPEISDMYGIEQNQYHRFDVWNHALAALGLAPAELHLRLAALLHDVGKPRTISTDERGNRHFYAHETVGANMADQLLARLRLPAEVREKVVHLIRYHMDLHLDGEMSDSAIRRMVRRIGLEHMHDLIQLRRADRLASGMRQGDLSPETVHLLQQVDRILKEDAALRVTDLAIDGDDVLRIFGRPPGPYVGRVLDQLLEEITEDPRLNEREWLLSRLAELSKVW